MMVMPPPEVRLVHVCVLMGRPCGCHVGSFVHRDCAATLAARNAREPGRDNTGWPQEHATPFTPRDVRADAAAFLRERGTS